MKKVIEEIKYCKHCNMETLQRKNSSRISAIAWIINIILCLITIGWWLIPFIIYLFIHMLSKMDTALSNSWICTQCNNKPLFGGK